MKTKYIIIPILVYLIACSGGKKQTLASEAEKEVTAIAGKDSIQRSKLIYNAADMVSIKKVEPTKAGRKILSPDLIRLDLGDGNIPEGEINLNDFYKKVTYITLKHPLVDKGLGFLGNAAVKVYTRHEHGENVSSWGGFNSSVFLSENNIVAGDRYFGYHVYNRKGEFLYTLASREEEPQYQSSENVVSFYKNDSKGEIWDLSVLGNKALINAREDSTSRTHIYDIEKQRGIVAFNQMFVSFMISDNTFLSYNGSVNIKDRSYLHFSIYSPQDGGLSFTSYPSYNPPATTKGRRSSPEGHLFAYYNEKLTTRQAYNDTIYRVKDANILEAVYALNSGSIKLSNEDAHSENKQGKLIIKQWFETDDFMFIMATIDQDFPINRSENKVMFRYYYYNKKDAKLYLKEGRSIYPEEYAFACNIEGAIPLLATTAKQYKKNLYTSYTKGQLKESIDSKGFANYPLEQQEKIKSLYADMPDGGLLLVILE